MRPWKRTACRPMVPAIVLWFAAGTAWGQDTTPPPTGNPAAVEGRATDPANPWLSEPSPPSLPQGSGASAADSAPRQPEPWLRQVRLDNTWLAGGGHRGLGVDEVELSGTAALPVVPTMAPLLITPGFATRFWSGPQSEFFPRYPDLPGQVYDVSLDLGWRPQFARWLFADLGITPGIYGDFHQLTSESFRPHARALGIVAFSPQCQVVAGLLYVNRLHTQVLPAGGVIWNPSDDTRCELLFPQPKVSYRLVALGLPQWWGFVMGEYGGGTWTIERASGATDLTDYRDLRLIVGLEWVGPTGVKGRLETGYVFNRSLQYTSATPGVKPDDTIMVRAGITF